MDVEQIARNCSPRLRLFSYMEIVRKFDETVED